MALQTWNEWRKQAPTFLEEAEEFRKWIDGNEEEEEEEEEDSDAIELTEQEWLEIKGIGPKLAKKLVENGPLYLEEIEQIKGIRQSVVENIKNYLDERSIP